MVKAIIIACFCFLIGNIIWPIVGEDKLYFVPQAVLIALCLNYIAHKTKGKFEHLFITYFLLLSYGNIVKELFYSYRMKQINDYIWGGLVTTWLIFNLIKWAIQKLRFGRK